MRRGCPLHGAWVDLRNAYRKLALQ